MKRFLPLVAAALLAGCAVRNPTTGGVTVTTNPFATAVQQFIASISKFTVTDLTWAVNDATARKDVVSLPCWTYLLAQVNSIPANGQGLPPLGVASAIQAARDGLAIGSGVPAPFQAACGALILDTQIRLAQFGVGAAGVVATGGALAPVAAVAIP